MTSYSFLGKGKKSDLLELLAETNAEFSPDMRVSELRDIIIKSPEFDESMFRVALERIINDRVSSERALAEREFELSKIQAQGAIATENPVVVNTVPDMKNLMPKFNPAEGDINLYLVFFERTCRKIGILHENYVSCLLPLLPLDVTHLIVRERARKIRIIMTSLKICYYKNLKCQRKNCVVNFTLCRKTHRKHGRTIYIT